MPKCQKCGKKFNTLQALKAHFNAVHPNERFVAPKSTSSRNITITVVVVIIIIGSLIGALIYTTGHSTTTAVQTGIYNTPILYSLYQNLTTVPFSVLSSVGSGGPGVNPPSSIDSSPLMNGTKPEILYIGAEFCPYCAAERWSLTIALSKFGNFSGLEYMQSAADDGDIATLTFLNATYTSKYPELCHRGERGQKPRQSPGTEWERGNSVDGVQPGLLSVCRHWRQVRPYHLAILVRDSFKP